VNDRLALFGMSEDEYLEIMRKGQEAEREYRREQAQLRSEALAHVAAVVGDRKLQHIKEYIAECEMTSDFAIVGEHGGSREDCTGYAFRWVYLDQYSNGGYCGDDFAGWVWIPLPGAKFLKFHYAM